MANDSADLTPSDATPLQGQTLQASLTVDDLERSVGWYTAALGCVVDREYEREGRRFGVVVRAGDVRILLTQDDGAQGRDRRKGEGISLMIKIGGSVDEVAERVKEHGWTLTTEPTDTPWGARICRVQDPDGFRYAIST
jgi:lactoylglutathione lyase